MAATHATMRRTLDIKLSIVSSLKNCYKIVVKQQVLYSNFITSSHGRGRWGITDQLRLEFIFLATMYSMLDASM